MLVEESAYRFSGRWAISGLLTVTVLPTSEMEKRMVA